MSLSRYATAFARLRADAKPFWPEATFHHAPYKPILLMAIMDLIAQQIIDVNLIRLDDDLVDAAGALAGARRAVLACAQSVSPDQPLPAADEQAGIQRNLKPADIWLILLKRLKQ